MSDLLSAKSAPLRRRCVRVLVRVTLASAGVLALVGVVIGVAKAVTNSVKDGPPVRVTQLSGTDILLVAPTNKDFLARVRALVPGISDEAVKLRPFLAIVANRGKSVVVAYAVAFKIYRPGKTPHVSTLQLKYPDRVIAPDEPNLRGQEIGPGEERLVGMALEVNRQQSVRSLNQALMWQQENFRDVTEIEVTLDAVLFDNGVLVGPDNSHVADAFQAYREAKLKVCQAAAEQLAAGASFSDVVRDWEATALPKSNVRRVDPLAVYPKLAADDMVRLQRRYGEEFVTHLITRTELNWSFTIQRAS